MDADEETRMAVPYDKQFPMEFDELLPEGAYVVREGTAGSVDVRSAAA
jgi:hypothetical protein